MCTVLFLYQVHPRYPLILTANRDEFFERRANGPQILSKCPCSIGGVDLQEQGTWLGANEQGCVVGLTNQRTHRLPDRTLRSRGQLVRDLLQAFSVREIRDRLPDIDPSQYNPFNLFFGDAENLLIAYARPNQEGISVVTLKPGVYGLSNGRIGSPDFPKAVRVQERAREVVTLPWNQLRDALIGIMSDHYLPPIESLPDPPPHSVFTRSWLHKLQAVCIHGNDYGTCSATLIALSKNAVAHYLFASGPPCRTPFEDVTHLLHWW